MLAPACQAQGFMLHTNSTARIHGVVPDKLLKTDKPAAQLQMAAIDSLTVPVSVGEPKT